MFGPFQPSGARLGGLLWKIPWKLSSPQKARHRRRLQHVDRVVDVLDTALKVQLAAQRPQTSSTDSISSPSTTTSKPHGLDNLTPAEIASTAEGSRLLVHEANKALSTRRSGRGPKQGDILPSALDPAFDPDSGLEYNHPDHSTQGHKPITLLSDHVRAQGTFKLLERWKAEMPSEREMLPRDKYTIFDRKARGYRKGIHKLPKWTRVSQRLNPPGF